MTDKLILRNEKEKDCWITAYAAAVFAKDTGTGIGPETRAAMAVTAFRERCGIALDPTELDRARAERAAACAILRRLVRLYDTDDSYEVLGDVMDDARTLLSRCAKEESK